MQCDQAQDGAKIVEGPHFAVYCKPWSGHGMKIFNLEPSLATLVDITQLLSTAGRGGGLVVRCDNAL